MKAIYVAATLAVVYRLRHRRGGAAHDFERDTFRSEFLLGGSLLLAAALHEEVYQRGVLFFTINVRCPPACRGVSIAPFCPVMPNRTPSATNAGPDAPCRTTSSLCD